MIKTYLKTAWRNLIKNKAFSVINIMGLAIGISVCFIIVLFVQQELSYDQFNTKADRIVRVHFKASINGGKINESTVMPPTAQALKNDYPQVEEAARIRAYGVPKIVYGDKTFNEGSFAFADANLFKVFTIPFVKGNPATALMEPNKIVITEELARKYFGNEEPVGKTLTFKSSNNAQFEVTGVIKKLPVNSHFHFDMFGSMAALPEAKGNSWMESNFYTYLLMQKGYDYKKLEAKLPNMVEKYMGPQILQAMGMSLTQFRTKGNELGFALMPLKDIHLHSATTSEFEPGGNEKYVFIFGAIAAFMLLIAAINFINLSTAGASKRAREVGVRKVLGSDRFTLIKQFLTESVLLTFIAVLISFLLIQLALPVFNKLSGKDLGIGFSIPSVIALLSLGMFVGLVAGIYPAFFLSSFKPIAVFKGRVRSTTKGFGLRSGLVVFQFFISVGLIIATIVIYQQMQFIQNRELGYDKDQLMVISNSGSLGKNERVFKDELMKDSRVMNVTISGYKPAGPSFSNNSLAYPEGNENKIMRTLEYHVDEQYIPTMGMQLAAGRNFSPELTTDSSGIIINEAAARAFGWGANAVGQRITRQNSGRGNNFVYTVIGVVKDFHFKSLHEVITPLLMTLNPDNGLIVKVKATDIAGLLHSMNQLWLKFGNEEPFEYAFMDELYMKTYAAEQRTGRILNIFALLTIFIACLGLFGLATYTAEQRTKEIGIRKVLGASVSQVTNMLSKEFLKLVMIACLIAFPLSWWAMHTWLQDFAYRTNISWWIFLLAAGLAMLVALFTVSFQAIKAAIANPVKSLRAE